MKTVFLVFTIVFISYENVSCENTESKDFTSQAVIHQLFDLFRTSSNEYELPTVDPLEFKYKEFHLENNFLNATCKFNDGVFKGLSKFQLQEVNFTTTDVSSKINIDWPLLTFTAEHYELAGFIFESIPLRGQGKVDIEVHSVSFWGKIYLKQSPSGKAILIDRLEDGSFSIGKVVSRTEFDKNIDEIISAMVEDLLAGYLTRFSKFLFAPYSEMITNEVNKILEKFETWDSL